MKGVAKDVRGALGSGVIALGLDGDEPQLFVTVSDDLVGARASRRATSSARRCRRSTAAAAAGRRWPRARAPAATALPAALEAIRSRLATAGGLDGLPPPHLQRDEGERARRLHRARHRDRVREGPRLRDRRGRPRHGPRRRPQAAGPEPHVVGDRRRHRGGRRQLLGRPPGGRGDGRLPAEPGRDRHRRRARQGLHDDAQPGAQAARPADHRGRSSRS